MMTRLRTFTTETLRTLPRVVLLAAALFAPLMAMQSVQAGSPRATIEDSRALSNGAGLVLLVSLQRS